MSVLRADLAEGVCVYLGDCREVLPTLDRDVVVVSDPPYGIGFRYEGSYQDVGGNDYVSLLHSLDPFAKALLQYPEETMHFLVRAFGPPEECFVWVYNSNTARQSRLFSFWGCDVDFSRVRVPAKNPQDPRVSCLVASYDWTADFQQVKNVSEEKTDHPCQVPTELMRRVIRFLDAELICDPFMGSGTTGVAAVKEGRQFVGVEIEEKYFDIACKRIDNALRQKDLFINAETNYTKPSQLPLLQEGV